MLADAPLLRLTIPATVFLLSPPRARSGVSGAVATGSIQVDGLIRLCRERFDFWLALVVIQFHSSNVRSSCALVLPETICSSTSVSHAMGSMPFGLAVWISVIARAQCFAPPSLPANSAFLGVRVCGRIARSTTVVFISTRPSSRNTTSPSQCRMA